MLNFGREISTPFDVALDDSDDAFDTWVDHKNALVERLVRVYKLARENIEKAQAIQACNYNKGRRNIEFEEGDLVLRRTHPKSDKTKALIKKFFVKWVGPYLIVEKFSPLVYLLEDASTGVRVGTYNVVDLKPYFARPAAWQSNIQPDREASRPRPSRKSAPLVRTYNLRSRTTRT